MGLLLSPLVWFCAMCVGGELLCGANLIQSANSAWVIANIVFAICFIPVGMMLARVASRLWPDSVFWTAVLDSASGRSLVVAQRELDQWTELTNEPAIEKP
jgi:hypothetical protein